jgi:phytoene/squalene synthetase
MSLHGLDHYLTDPEDWAEYEERDDAARCMGRMMDDDFDYQEDLERLTERLEYLRRLSPPEINDEVPF